MMKKGKTTAKENIVKTKQKIEGFFNNLTEKIKAQLYDVFSSKKKTFAFLALVIFTVLFAIQMLIIFVRNSFYCNFSDDILQYYTIMVDFVAQIKAGTISFFNLNNYLGASYYSDVYYIPLDIFTTITFILSYLMPTQLAYSVTELIKIWAGVMAFAYYLNLKGMKNKTIFWMGLVYFVSGGTVSFMAFPAFLSLTFYLPLALIVIHWSFKGKKWIVPLFAFVLVFYNFYLAYMALIFTGLMFIMEYVRREDFRFGKFLCDGAIFLGLLLLGVGMSLIILYPSILYVLQDTYRQTGTFNYWGIQIGSYELKLFEPEIYIRFLAKMFAEQYPTGFYGFSQDYTKEHISLYITMTGLLMMSGIFFLKDRSSKVYKATILIGVLMAIFPFFSYLFSGTTDQPYTRWINCYPLVMTIILAHVFDKTGFEKLNMKQLTIPAVLLMGLDIYLVYYYIHKLDLLRDFKFADVLTLDWAMMIVSAVVILLFLIFGWMKKPGWLKCLFVAECCVALANIYGNAFFIGNKNDTFEEMYSINDVLKEQLAEDGESFYRVYVEMQAFNVEDTNFNRMTVYPTNTEIFHSWTDYESDTLATLLFNLSTNAEEHQSKSKLNTMALFLNQFLGYKYVLTSTEHAYYLDSDYFELIYSDSEYVLFRIVNAENFQVYESYASYSEYEGFCDFNNNLEAQKIFLMAALIDTERYEDMTFNLEEIMLDDRSSENTIYPSKTITSYELVAFEGSGDDYNPSGLFFRFDGSQLNIGFDAGALYINVNSGIYSGDVYMEFADGSMYKSQFPASDYYDVKCEFGSEPVAIYFETNGLNTRLSITYRMEMARDSSAYLVFDLSGIEYTDGAGMLYLRMSQKLGTVIFVDAEGNETYGFKDYYYFDSAPVRVYIFKTGNMYSNVNNFFQFSLHYVYDGDYLEEYENLTNGNKLYANGSLEITNGTISLSYLRTSETTYDQIVVIPVTYSEEWTVTSEQQYETISASGGMLGIIVPAGIEDVSIELRFIPKGLKEGALGSLAFIAVYLGIFLPGWISEKKKRNKEQISKEMNES